MTRLSQKTLTITLPADVIAQNFFGGGESACFHCFDARFDSGVKWCTQASSHVMTRSRKSWPSLSKHSFNPVQPSNLVPIKSGKLSWYPACANFSKTQTFVNDCVHRSHRKIRLLCLFHDRLCINYPGSDVPHAECSQEWLLWAGNHHGRDCHWWMYSHLWNVYTIQMSYCGWVSHHRTVLEVFCRYSRVLRLRSQETSSPHAVPCTH